MNTSHISKEWIDTFNRLGSEGKLKATADYDAIFNLDKLFGKKLYTLPMGHVVFPTGHIVVCDPLTHLAAVDNKSYIRTVEPGTYPIETKVAELDTDYYRYVLTRVVFKDTKPVQYELALKGHEDLSELDDCESYIGFPVDAGLATIVDKVTVDAYKEFDRQWYENNPDGNIYDDYFDELFKLKCVSKSPNSNDLVGTGLILIYLILIYMYLWYNLVLAMDYILYIGPLMKKAIYVKL